MFMNDLSIISRQMRVFSERALKQADLGFPEQLVVMHLMSHKTSNQQQIAESLGIDQGAITKTINKLESKGFISREINPKNKREKILTLTPAASNLKDELHATYLKWSQAIFKNITDEQRAQFEETMAQMAKNSATLLGKDE